MKNLIISDMTLKQASGMYDLSFKEKIEIAKLLDRLNVSVIELAAVSGSKVDDVLVRTISSCVKNSTVCLPVLLVDGGAAKAYELIEIRKFKNIIDNLLYLGLQDTFKKELKL